MIDDRKVKVNKRGKAVYTYDPYKKKRRVTDILKKVAAVGVVSGSLIMFFGGLGGSIAFTKVDEDIQQIAIENKFEYTIDGNSIINDKEAMQQLEKHMASSSEVTKEEYSAFLKTKEKAENLRVFSLSTGVGGAGLAVAGFGTQIGVSIAEEKRFRAARKKRQEAMNRNRYERRYDEDWTRAELDIPLCNQIKSPEETEERKTR